MHPGMHAIYCIHHLLNRDRNRVLGLSTKYLIIFDNIYVKYYLFCNSHTLSLRNGWLGASRPGIGLGGGPAGSAKGDLAFIFLQVNPQGSLGTTY